MVKGIFFVLNFLAVFLLLRGHDHPGGGFIAGLATAISFVMLSLALGWTEFHRLLRFDPARLAVSGLALATFTALAPVAFGHALLEHFQGDVQVPLLGAVHLGTPLLFDLGVYLVVVGITCKILFALGKSTEGLRAFIADEEARYSARVEEPIEADRPTFEDAEAAHPPEARRAD